MGDDSGLAPSGGEGALGPGREEQRVNRAFLALQEQCVRAGLIEAVAEGVGRLTEMAKDPKLSRRTRQRAEKLLQDLARHVAPAPAKVAVDARSLHLHQAPQGIDRRAYQDLVGDEATRGKALDLLESVALPPALPSSVAPSPPEPPAGTVAEE